MIERLPIKALLKLPAKEREKMIAEACKNNADTQINRLADRLADELRSRSKHLVAGRNTMLEILVKLAWLMIVDETERRD